jgi:hypothetical protein
VASDIALSALSRLRSATELVGSQRHSLPIESIRAGF